MNPMAEGPHTEWPEQPPGAGDHDSWGGPPWSMVAAIGKTARQFVASAEGEQAKHGLPDFEIDRVVGIALLNLLHASGWRHHALTA